MATTLLDLIAKLRLDSSGYTQGLNQAEGQANTFGSKLKKGLGVAAKAGAAAVAAVGTAAVAMGKQALDAYADYEQLEGGIKTLYGENSEAAKQMMQQASEAWQTAGMSANEYMKMAIESSAAMISSLGGDADKAAEMMDKAIVDMSDNVNKMGTSMEAIQNAYRGFSRGNFTMLDNLALGFAGTKEGMQQLLDKAEEYAAKNGEVRDFSVDSYADIVEAIHLVQEEMGIAGATADEASTTIQGSLNAAKAAWQNLLTGIADDNADFDALVNNFVDSVVTAAGNIIPRIETILQGLAKLITEAADKLLPIIIDTIVTNLPTIVEAGVQLIVALITGLLQATPQIVAAIPDIIKAIWDGLKNGWPELQEAGLEAAKAIVGGLAEGVWYFWTFVDEALTKIDNAINEWMENAVKYVNEKVQELGKSLKDWFMQRVSDVVSFIEDIIRKVTDFVDKIREKFNELMQWLYDHTIGKVVEIVEDIKLKIQQFIDFMDNFISEAKAWGRDLILNFIDGIAEKFPLLTKAVQGIAGLVQKVLGFSEPEIGPLSNFHTYAPDMMKLFAQGIKDNENLVLDQMKRSFDFSNLMPTGEIEGFGGMASGAGSVTNNYITVNGIEELEEVLRWFESRQVVERMA